MTTVYNTFQQAIGQPLPDWVTRPLPARVTIGGRYCQLAALSAERHAADLYAAFSQAVDGRDWTYMAVGPFADAASYVEYARRIETSADPLHYAVIDLKTGKAVGSFALMRIDAANGVIEVGSVSFSPLLQRTAISTEAQYLLMKYVFETLGYRRYEWKCDSLNAPSRQTATRLGFQYEGIFRQAIVYKGRSRDTAWFSVLDSEWPAQKLVFERWLAAENFNEQGEQIHSLSAIRSQLIRRLE